MVDISEIAARLDADEKLKLHYKYPVRDENGVIEYETRVGALLDVAEENNTLFVSYNGGVVWVKAEEVIKVDSDD